MSRLFLGLDSSTQSLSAMIVDIDEGTVLYDESINFSEAFPAYGTENGVLKGDNPAEVHAPPGIWLDAMDALLARLNEQGAPLGDVLAISGSGQQHGSVYLNAAWPNALADLDPGLSLAENMADCYSRKTAPIWMDSSTTEECGEIETALGGPARCAELTGSAAFERFSGPQIRKFWKQEGAAFEDTAHIALVSSFMASILAGHIVPLDPGDGSGMNMMDISRSAWSPEALAATAPGLSEKMPPIEPSSTLVGKISGYFSAKYGVNPDARVQVWSGDNPNSLIGLGLVEQGLAAISCGTSDTYFGFMCAPNTDPRGEGHVFGAPTGDYMTLICFKNGSLAREQVKDAYGFGWKEFCAALRETPAGNEGKLMLPYFEPEIVPHVLEPGVRRKNLSDDDAAGNCRAVVEAQAMSQRLHSEWMGERPRKIYATGGGSRDVEILQIFADVHGCPVTRYEVGNSAALGASLRAAQGWLKKTGSPMDWGDLVKPFLRPDPERSVIPDPDAVAIYNELIKEYAAFEVEA